MRRPSLGAPASLGGFAGLADATGFAGLTDPTGFAGFTDLAGFTGAPVQAGPTAPRGTGVAATILEMMPATAPLAKGLPLPDTRLVGMRR